MLRKQKFLCWTTAVVTLGAAAPLFGQTFAANVGNEPVIGPVAPHTDGRVHVPGHNRHADESLLFGRVRNGVYTVDGMVAKVQMNYDINGVEFLYLFVPGVGTAVVSVTADPEAVTTQAKLAGNELTFTAGEHHFKLTGVALASNKGTAPSHLYVKLDRAAWGLNRHPMLGFGNKAELPYAWPGALPAQGAAEAEEKPIAPPIPAVLLPSTSTVTPRLTPTAQVSPDAVQPSSLR